MNENELNKALKEAWNLENSSAHGVDDPGRWNLCFRRRSGLWKKDKKADEKKIKKRSV